MQKLYCYVGESGQDDRSRYFVVVVVVSYNNQQAVREELERLVRSSRDESEGMIRLADMWAGCTRLALLENKEASLLLGNAKKEAYLRVTFQS